VVVLLYAIERSTSKKKYCGRIGLPSLFVIKDLKKLEEAVLGQYKGFMQISMTGAGLEIVAPDSNEITFTIADEILKAVYAAAEKIAAPKP
jgi:acetylglutamate synthase